MRKGTRTVHRLCQCGCKQQVPPTISKTNGQVTRYPKFIAGHGNKDWGKRWADRLAQEGHPNSKPLGSKQSRADGYIKIKTQDGWIYEHRHILNASPDKIVHHKDGNPSNNHPDNLEEMTIEVHQQIHHSLPKNQWSRKFFACTECSTTIRKHSAKGLCTRCYQQQQAALKGFW